VLPVPRAVLVSDLSSSAWEIGFRGVFSPPGTQGPLPCAGSSAEAERITPGKAPAQGSPDGLPCFRGCLPSFCLRFEVPQGFSYKALSTDKQNLGLGRRVALACFLGLSDLRCCAVGGGLLLGLEEVGLARLESRLPQRLFLPPFFHDISQDLMLLF